MKSFKMTALAAAAVASMGLAGQAQALTASSAGTSGSLFLYVFEDRQDNPAATNTAIFDLGVLATGFDTASNFSLDLSANSAWTTYVDTMIDANVHWGVFGTSGSGNAGSQMFTTMSTVPGSIGGSAFSTAVVNSNSEINLYGTSCTSCGFNIVTANDLASASWDDNAGILQNTKLTAKFGDNMDFFKWTSVGTKSTMLATKTAFSSDTAAGTDHYWTLSSNGELNYVAAPVPEADTYALLLAGLGIVGFMARRRKV